ncbi:MAG: insulinase family protein [Defluviitaleaceae bacterium]|nr:insulinase family protein [Defluviitaleaceae bacterium]
MNHIKFNGVLNERIYFKHLSNGVKCYIIPKLGYVEQQAMLGINYGSVDYAFSVGGKKYNHPAGVAHFIEHKMFEDKEINVFERFMSLKASVNAFTNFTTTAYYFSTSENFYECLRLLFEFVQRPYFTRENVEKEKPIIVQEIEMYEDNPFWVMYFNLLGALYKESPIRQKIAGDAGDIQHISIEALQQAYRAFYRPENMVICCVGEVNPEQAVETVEECVRVPSGKFPAVSRDYGKEPKHAVERCKEKKMALARPMFQLGFKDTDFTTPYAAKTVATKILLDMLFGESSDFFENLYTRGVVDSPFALEYQAGSFYGTVICTNSADRPQEAADLVLDEISRVRIDGLDRKQFERIKRKHMGRFIRGFNSIDKISHGQLELAFRGIDLFDMLQAYQKITFARVCERFERVFREDNHAASIIKCGKD